MKKNDMCRLLLVIRLHGYVAWLSSVDVTGFSLPWFDLCPIIMFGGSYIFTFHGSDILSFHGFDRFMLSGSVLWF